MSVNKHIRHLLILPEDDANRQIANGFHLGLDQSVQRKVQVLGVAEGWREVLSRFERDHVAEMERNPNRSMVLLIDFDDDAARLDTVRDKIPERLRERVFVLGAQSEPESLKRAGLGSYEKIGQAIARDCRDNTETILNHALLQHNAGELSRLRLHVRPILFPSS
jgi:hypothetical protein